VPIGVFMNKKWEYHFENRESIDIDKMGKEGWELILINQYKSTQYEDHIIEEFVLKREINE
jgi:hypothetical protein